MERRLDGRWRLAIAWIGYNPCLWMPNEAEVMFRRHAATEQTQLGMPDVAERRSVRNKTLIIGTDSRAFQQSRQVWLTHAGEARLTWQAAT